ncbi:MAG: lactate utilization protein [Smithellaceae bacterium]|nr:lactate utilization protein [Smithellaceae bacterium]
MIEFEKDKIRKSVPKILEEMKKRRFDPHFFETAAEARDFIVSQINPGETVGIGGSITLREDLAVVGELRKKGITVVDHWDSGADAALRLELKRKQRMADVFLTGVNAVTRDGILVNMDGGGNRVAGACSGPKRVIAAFGMNKLTDSLELAIHRTRHHAAIINSIRLERKVPCAQTGICTDCHAPERICAALLILFTKPGDIDKFTLVLVNEDLGH